VTAPQLAPGQSIAGKYTIRAPLGYGGATATYAAQGPGREVVVKLFSQQITARGDVLGGLKRATAATNALPADATAHVLESAFDPQTGAPYIVTELIALPSLLAQVVQSGPLPAAEVIALLQGIARAVDPVHAQGIVHGALKPRNVFVGPAPGRSVRVIDFGVAAARAALPTNEGWSVAAPWMAPEQAQGGVAGPPADVFSAALVAFFAATGKSYWRACQTTTLDLAAWQQEIAAPRVPPSARAAELGASLPGSFDVALGRALAPSPGERFASLGELASALAQGAAPRMAMTMPLNAMPAAALEALRRAAPSPHAPVQPSGGDTLAIASPAEAARWQQAAPISQPPMGASPYGPPSGAQPPAPQPMAAVAPWVQAPVAQPMPQAAPPMMGGNVPGPAQFGAYPSGLPSYAQPQASLPPPPPPQSRTGLFVVLAIMVLLVAGGVVAAVVLLRAPKGPTEPVATHGGTAASVTPPSAPPPASAANNAAVPPVETQDAQSPAAVATGNGAETTVAGSRDAGADAPAPAEVTVVCVPDCDTAKIDDKALVLTDAGLVAQEPLDVSPGPHTIVVGRTSYASQTKRVTLKPGQRDTETFHLNKPGAAVAKPCGKFLERCPN
jgi:serine/threonine protein kinase